LVACISTDRYTSRSPHTGGGIRYRINSLKTNTQLTILRLNSLEALESTRRPALIKKEPVMLITGFEKIVEERIRTAQKRGEFDNLEGSGKPLAFAEDGSVPEDLRLAYKMLKNADCLPPEIELKKEIERTEDLLAGMHDVAERYHLLKKLNFLIMKLNISRKGDARFDVPQRYLALLDDRIGSSTRKNS
jgi:hypothetical protein